MRLSDQQARRYSRHILLPEVGGKGQRRLLESRVFVVGAGGLGSPVLLYLAAAGVGTIEVIDGDAVDETNLQRQVIHTTPRVGMPKAESAREAIAALNPDVRVIEHRTMLARENALDLMRDADVVIEGSDNFATRYLVNDATVALRKPLVWAALFRFEGQATVFRNDRPESQPCYRCLFPEMPPAGLVPSCSEAGILGPVAGILGCIQAAETVKVLLGLGESLAGRLLMVDALDMAFRTVALRRDPACALTGDAPTQHGLALEYVQPACDLPPRQ